MTSITEKIIERFPYPTIKPIIGIPNYETITELLLQLNANAASVQTHLGGGNLCLLALTVTSEVYATLSDNPFDPPQNPGPSPEIPDRVTGPQIAETRAEYEESVKMYKTYDATDKALKQLLLGAVEDMFVRALRYRHIGYANVTTLQLLTHLYTVYVNISATGLQENDEKMKTPYDPNLPIETLFDQVEDAMEFAVAGKAPYIPQQIVNIAFNIIFQTGTFSDECKMWKRRPEAQKTWEQFKTFFAIAHQEIREATQTVRDTGYNANIMQTDTAEAITNLANVTLTDKQALTELTSTVSRLSKDLADTNAQLMKALAEINTLQKELQTERKKSKKHGVYKKYCWTHGPNNSHNSNQCRAKAQGHIDTATADNKCGVKTEPRKPRK